VLIVTKFKINSLVINQTCVRTKKKKNEKIIQKGEKNERTNSFAAVKCKPHTNKSHLHMRGNFICMKCDVAYPKKKRKETGPK